MPFPKRLLLSTDHSVAGLARAVSYTNLHHFYRVFSPSPLLRRAALVEAWCSPGVGARRGADERVRRSVAAAWPVDSASARSSFR